jgi:hypothetical protein
VAADRLAADLTVLAAAGVSAAQAAGAGAAVGWLAALGVGGRVIFRGVIFCPYPLQ